MKNKFLYYIIFFCAISFWLVSCDKENDQLDELTPEFISIESLRDKYQNETTVIISSNDNKEVFIGGIVISNSGHGNIPENKIILQNYENNRLRGIMLSVEGDINRYQSGDSLVVRVDNKELKKVDGVLQVMNLTVKEVGIISSGNEEKVHIETDNLNDIIEETSVYENTLVKLLSVDVLDDEAGRTFGDGDLELSDGSNIVSLKTLETASYAIAEVPLEGDFTGVLFYSNDLNPYLMPRSNADYSGEFLAPEDYIGFPVGWENIVGTRKTGLASDGFDDYLSGRWFLNNAFSLNSSGLVHKNEEYAMMMSNVNTSIVSMDFDLDFGASKFSFYYGAATLGNNDSSPITLYAEYSQDSGENWLPLDPNELSLLVDDQTVQYFKEYDLEIEGPVRFRIRKEADSGRLIIDDLFVKPNED